MADALKIDLDWRQFDEAVARYSGATGKTMAESGNRAMFNVGLKGLKLAQKAQESAIDTLEDPKNWPWWPKVVAASLIKQMGKRLASKMAKAKTVKGAARMMQRFNRRAYTIDQARRKSRALIIRRLRAVGFIKFFFGALANGFSPIVHKSLGGFKKFKGFEVQITAAKEGQPVSSAVVAYMYRSRGEKTAGKAEALLQKTLPEAIAATIVDMEQHIQDKMKIIDRTYSAGGA